MKKLLILFAFAFMLVACTPGGNKWRAVEENFKTLPMSVRPNPLWFWNDTPVDSAELVRQMADFKKAGYGGLSILPFGRGFKPEYLSDAYFEAYRVCINEAEKLGMTLWIYDEYGFPSGTAGDINGDGIGRFKQKYPQHTNKRLDKDEYVPKPQSVFEATVPADGLMAVVAMDTLTLQRINLRSNVVYDGPAAKLTWEVPAGNWKVLAFTCVDAGNTIVDYMSPEAVNLFIGMTHDEYYKRFSESFGKTIVGTFFDEPTLYYAEGRSWTPAFNTKFEEKYGINPELYYPALWYDIGAETAEARNFLFGFRTELYAEGFTKLVSDWSVARGVHATGHQDNEEVLNPVGTSGDLMKCFKYLDAPGIDKIGGNRPAERFYKLISSAAYNWDHSLVMSETYGDRGNIGWTEIYSIAMDQYAKGINLLIPHAVWYNTERVVFRPELSLRNPIYADSLNVFNNYLARLNAVMQNDARWVGDVAVIYPIETMQSGHYMDGPLGYYRGGVEIPDLDYLNVSDALFDSLGYDYMYLHPEVLRDQCTVAAGKLLLGNKVQHNTFSTLVAPACKTISRTNMEKVSEFARSGGTVVFTTLLPQKATLAADNDEVLRLLNEIVALPNVLYIAEPTVANLSEALRKFPQNFMLKFTGSQSLRNIHKVYEGKNLWFFANPDHQTKTVEFELGGKFDLRLWDPHTGTTDTPADATHQAETTTVKLTLPPCRSVFLVEK